MHTDKFSTTPLSLFQNFKQKQKWWHSSCKWWHLSHHAKDNPIHDMAWISILKAIHSIIMITMHVTELYHAWCELHDSRCELHDASPEEVAASQHVIFSTIILAFIFLKQEVLAMLYHSSAWFVFQKSLLVIMNNCIMHLFRLFRLELLYFSSV